MPIVEGNLPSSTAVPWRDHYQSHSAFQGAALVKFELINQFGTYKNHNSPGRARTAGNFYECGDVSKVYEQFRSLFQHPDLRQAASHLSPLSSSSSESVVRCPRAIILPEHQWIV